MNDPALSRPENSKPGLDLQRFMLDLLASQGALVDVPEYALVEALLPAETAAALDTPAEITMAFDYDAARETPGAHFVTFGHPLLDRAVELGKTLGKVTQKLAVVDRLSVPPGLLERVEKKLDFVRCKRPALKSSALVRVEYLLFLFMVRFISDEKQEAAYPVLVDLAAARDVTYQLPWLSGIFFAEASGPGEALLKLAPAASCGYARAYEIAKNALPTMIEKDLSEFQRRMHGYLKEEEKRLEAYYAGIAAEIEKRLARLDEDDPRRQKLAQKLAATRADHQKRRQDIVEKFKSRVECWLDSATVYILPKVKLIVEVQHKSLAAPLELYYNVAANQLELPACPSCGQLFSVVHIARNGTALCPDCGAKNAAGETTNL
ncbi:MAG: hypothetical protein M1379_02690 [Firmicutes bacterium]|nr:hypothetical protein [Bacillota bacterium]